VFDLKLTAKQLQRASKRCEKEESQERSKVKKAIQQGNNEGAQIYAENAIRKHTESLQLLRLSSRVDAVASKLQTKVTMGTVKLFHKHKNGSLLKRFLDDGNNGTCR
jgi:charged multivesicular body protein 1